MYYVVGILNCKLLNKYVFYKNVHSIYNTYTYNKYLLNAYYYTGIQINWSFQ